MSEAEQDETSQRTVEDWNDLKVELAEVRAKRDQLDAMNLRVTGNLRRTIEEREQAVKVAAALREQVDTLNAAMAEMKAQRDTMERYRDQMRVSRDEARKVSSEVRQQLVEMTAERDAVKEANGSQFRMVQALQRDVSQLQAERDAARKFADKLQVDLGYCRCEHDAAREELAQAKEAADMFAAENTSLQDTVRQLRAKQIHDDLPGILCAIQLAAEQARELI